MPTWQQYMDGMQRAKAAGDAGAVEYFREKATKAERAETAKMARPEAPKGFVGAAANLAAGGHRFLQGAGQLVGLSSTEDVRRADEIRKGLADDNGFVGKASQFVGENLPGVLIPGGAVLKGAKLAQLAKAGMTGGAVGGLSSATDDESGVLAGKAKNALAGAAFGGLGVPAVAGGARLLGKVGGRAMDYVMPGRAGAEAGERMATALATDGGKVTPADVVANMDAVAADVAIPGVKLPTAALVGSRPMIGMHHYIRQSGGPFAEPLKLAEPTANRIRTDFLKDRLGNIGGKTAQEIEAGKDAIYSAAKANARMAPGAQRYIDGFQTMLDTLEKDTSGNVKSAMGGIIKEFKERAATAIRNNDWTELHEFRKTGLDDRVSALLAGREKNAADELNRLINRDIRPSLDFLMEHASGGGSKQLVGKNAAGALAPGAKAMSRLEQLKNSKELLDTMERQVGVTSMGDPLATSGRMVSEMRDLRISPTNDYGQGKVSPKAARALQQVEKQADLLRTLQAGDIGQAGSQTHALKENVPKIIATANRSPFDMNTMGAAGIMGYALNLPVAAAIIGSRWGEKRIAQATMNKMSQLLADPDEMRKVLVKVQQGKPLSPAEKIAQEVFSTTTAKGAGAVLGRAVSD